MPTAKKVAQVEELSEKIGRTTIAIGADYRGLNVKQMTNLRRSLRQAGVELRVVKNSLMRLASEKAGRNEFLEIIQGPTAIAFAYGEDVVAPAKALNDFIRGSRLEVVLYGAFVEGQILDRRGVEDLASVPPKEILLAKIGGALISPAAELAGLLSATLREFVGLVNARTEQLGANGAQPSVEEAGAPPAEASDEEVGEAQAEPAAAEAAADDAAAGDDAAGAAAEVTEAAVEEPTPPDDTAEPGESEASSEPDATEDTESDTETTEGDE